MSKVNSPFQTEVPTKKRLITAILVAIVGAVIILVTLILPSEYDIDPTGIGGVLGLDQISEPKVNFSTDTSMDVKNYTKKYSAVAKEEAELTEPTPLPNTDVLQVKKALWKSQEITFNMAAGEKLEYKAVMLQNQVLLYHWKSDKGDAYFDFHADSPRASKDFWVRYQEGTSSDEQGSLVAPFYGNHGWFWENKNEHPITITLNISGYYSKISKL